ncbi:cellulase family glycosylhydrolase [Haloechinothrix sp. YIM 98757]|uniref:Cellulase family glycosylhydrolase n=1 Tax=Haloechinothrix aidingensis TaxID=2752311 RepID=A0A838A810_9PSEU|nr:cellulase family glycosylhydrolase [Haloechinothrix aidingensis]MBA0124777.1 cellulase family glycosylhydrolase [Haloechinothrix aidingensis]
MEALIDSGVPRGSRVAGVVLTLVALVAAVLGAPPGAAAEPVQPPETEIDTPLRTDGERIRDAAGRDVILRGISVIDKREPFYPDVGPEDFRRIRDLGLNHIRLGISWEGIMPEQGRIDQGYLDAVRNIVRGAGREGLLVILDMHQDLFGGPRGNGAPDWAYRPGWCPHLELAEPTGAWAANYASPEINCAVTRFWRSEELQAYYSDAWKAMAGAVADEANVIGYDLMNEPWQGYIPPVLFERQYLYPSQARWLEAIREVDPEAIGFVEPNVLKSLTVVSPPPAGLLPDNSVYSPHLYGPWDFTSESELLQETRRLADVNFGYSAKEASGAGVPLWLGEWGVFTTAPGAADYATHVYDMVDDALAGTAIWEYGDSAYGPFDTSTWEPTPLYESVLRAYPQAVPGTLREINYDPRTRGLDVAWSGGDGGVVSLRAPAGRYPEGVSLRGSSDWLWDAQRGVVTARVPPGDGELALRPAGS